MKILLVLCLATVAYSRPQFAYTSVINGVNPALTYAINPVVNPSVYTIPQPIVYSAPVVVAKSGCRNDAGEVVACIGETLVEVKKSEGETTPEEEKTKEETVVVVKREADAQILLNTPLTYANTINTPLTYANTINTPITYTNAINPIAYRSCVNAQGSLVPCAAPSLAAPVAFSAINHVPLVSSVISPIAAPVAVAPVEAPVAIEEKADTVEVAEAPKEEGIISVKKREAEPQILLNTLASPYINTLPIVRPLVYTTSGCVNNLGLAVPCA